MNIFQIAANDQSVFYLGQIFGPVGNVIPPIGGAIGAGGVSSYQQGSLLLGTMFKTFNSVVLAVGALIVVYITVFGVMATAQEGEFLGKKWHSLWVPLRTVFGIAALVPTTSGYSSIQILMMWVIMQGIGAADSLWSTALRYVNIAGSPYASPTVITVNLNNSLSTLYQGLVCQASAKATYANPISDTNQGSYYCAERPGDSFCTNPNNFPGASKNTYDLGPQGYCGTLTYCNVAVACQDATSAMCYACRAQVSALSSIVPTLQSIANRFVAVDYAYRSFYSTNNAKAPSWVQSYCSANNIASSSCCLSNGSGSCQDRNNTSFPNPNSNNGGNPDLSNANSEAVKLIYWPYALKNYVNDSNFIEASASAYANALAAAASTGISEGNNQLSQQFQEAESWGWIFAGAYYYTIAKFNNNNLVAVNPPLVMSNSSPAASQNNGMAAYRNNYQASTAILDQLKNIQNTQVQKTDSMSTTLTSNLEPPFDSLMNGMGDLANAIMKSFQTTVTGDSNSQGMHTNPMASIQNLGKSILIAVEVTFFATLIIAIVASALGYISPFVLGTGVVNPVGPMVSTVFLLIVPLLLGFMGLMLVFGGMLAVYVPLIPYVVFTFGAIHWFIATIETMVAAPLVALGILSPGGHHEILGKAEPALMLIFSIFLRPGLMIFGLMAGMLLASAVITMINVTYMGVMGNIAGIPSLVELIVFMASYLFLVISALNKCFALIHIIPDRVLRWLNHQVEDSGAGEALSEIKRGGEGASGGALSSASAAGQQPESHMKGAKERQGAKNTEARQARKDGPKVKDADKPKT